MDERLIHAVDAMATSFQWLTITVILLAVAVAWSHLVRAQVDRYWLERQRQRDKKDAEREERGFE